MAQTDRQLQGVLRKATACARQGQWLSAESMCEYLLEIDPAQAQALHLLAEVHAAQGRLQEALRGYQRLLDRKPRDFRALYNRAMVLKGLGRHDEALRGFDAVLALRGRDLEAHGNRGAVLQALGRTDEACAAFDRALGLDPGHADARIGRGMALAAAGRHAEALADYERVLARAPQRADAHYNRGNALRALERDREALASYERALELEPQHADGHWNRAWSLLALGDYARGWPEYEWRTRSPQWLAPPIRSAAPRWSGSESLDGRRLFLQAEQGVGDTLQFLRYVPLLAARGASILLELHRSLGRLCAPYEQWAQLVLEGDPVPAHDLQCPIASLPHAFGTTLATIPTQLPYLGAAPALAAAWRERMAMQPGARRVGLAWAGNPRQRSEPRRGIGLEPCLPLFEAAQVQWFGLQVGERAADLARLPPGTVTDLSGSIADFADTAALMENLDLVITTDTSVAHLAGAMGKPVWVLLMYSADWRWLRGRADSPWYPSARLFRQPKAGDWESVIERVRAALDEARAEFEQRP